MGKSSPASLEVVDHKFYRFLKIEIRRLIRQEQKGLDDQFKILWWKKNKFIEGVLRALDSSLKSSLETDVSKDFDSLYAKTYKDFNLNALILSWLKKPVDNIKNFNSILSSEAPP